MCTFLSLQKQGLLESDAVLSYLGSMDVEKETQAAELTNNNDDDEDFS